MAPSFMASTALSMLPKAVIMTTEVWGERRFTSFSISTPFIRGIFTSAMTRSYGCRLNFFSPSAPLRAVVTEWPLRVSASVRADRISDSSSTTRIGLDSIIRFSWSRSLRTSAHL